jgi:cell division septum initiation protein DivIVA
MQRMQWTPDQRDEALRLLAEVGKAEAARRTGIPAGTIASWGARTGVAAPAAEQTRVATDARLATIAERKARLAERMLTEAEGMVGQLHQRTYERKPMVVSDGQAAGSHIEIAEVTYDRPPTADQKRIVEAVAILVDKIQLLTGDATARIEQTGEGGVPVKREQLVTVVDQLAARRSA